MTFFYPDRGSEVDTAFILLSLFSISPHPCVLEVSNNIFITKNKPDAGVREPTCTKFIYLSLYLYRYVVSTRSIVMKYIFVWRLIYNSV